MQMNLAPGWTAGNSVPKDESDRVQARQRGVWYLLLLIGAVELLLGGWLVGIVTHAHP